MLAKSLLKEKYNQLGRKEFPKETLANYQFSSTLARSELCDLILGDMNKFTYELIGEHDDPVSLLESMNENYLLKPASLRTPFPHG